MDDIEEFEDDPSVKDKLGGLATSKTMGSYLRDFDPEHIEALRGFLTRQAFNYRTRIDGENTSNTFDQDSTFHEQHGLKMEGVVMSRYDVIGLDSLRIHNSISPLKMVTHRQRFFLSTCFAFLYQRPFVERKCALDPLIMTPESDL